MSGTWMLLLLLLAAALPVVAAFFSFRAVKSPVTLSWFLISLGAGIASILPAALIQSIFPSPGKGGSYGLGQLFFGVFLRIALVEEASRLVTLIPLIKAGTRRLHINSAFGAALGLVAGLGFAVMENAFYGAADIGITLLRAFAAAPLHGACGIRAGAAVSLFKERPAKAVYLFVSSVLIHGAYNLMIASPAFPSLLAILTALAALFSSLPLIKNAEAEKINTFSPKSSDKNPTRY